MYKILTGPNCEHTELSKVTRTFCVVRHNLPFKWLLYCSWSMLYQCRYRVRIQSGQEKWPNTEGIGKRVEEMETQKERRSVPEQKRQIKTETYRCTN